MLRPAMGIRFMNSEEVFLHIRHARIIAILRGLVQGREIDLAEALVAGGVTAMEVSAVTHGSTEIIRNLCTHFSGRAVIGIGTVVTKVELQTAAAAGASFVVSPGTDPEIIHETRRLGLASFPGAFTPTEVMLAARSGAHAVKIFPAATLGSSFIRALHGPFPNVEFVPTGGIRLDNLREYLAVGSLAVGIGSELVGKGEFEHFDAAGLTEKSRAYVKAAHGAAHE
jgi:2-dehydro-3-deoxyphosphogluconate aldolase / (4S)-4-hydroxy-2-oxoglutarate aldolase